MSEPSTPELHSADAGFQPRVLSEPPEFGRPPSPAPQVHVGIGWVAAGIVPGLLAAVAIAVGASLIARVVPLPPTFLALACGMAVAGVLGRQERLAAGVQFSSKTVLQLGIVLVAARLDAARILVAGWPSLLLVVGATVATIIAGAWLGRRAGLDARFALLTAGAVSICGASAALALASVLWNERKDGREDTVYVVAMVTLLGSVAMLLLPPLAGHLGWNAHQTAVLLGGGLHELAQASGAGFGISENVGMEATAVKLVRVALLVPVAAVMARTQHEAGGAARLVPTYLMLFALVASLGAAGLIPAEPARIASVVSGWCLIVALAGLGLRISPRDVLARGVKPAAVMAGQSVLLIVLLCIGITLLG